MVQKRIGWILVCLEGRYHPNLPTSSGIQQTSRHGPNSLTQHWAADSPLIVDRHRKVDLGQIPFLAREECP